MNVELVELHGLRPRELLALRRHEEVEQVVQVRGGVLVGVRDQHLVPDWDDAKRAEICHRVAVCLAGGGAAWGVRAAEVLVGLAAVDAEPVGGDPGVVALDLLHVSAGWRGHGLARSLTERAAAFATSRGAHTLYVSASNTQRTVAVYRRFGAVVATPPDPTWFAREPLDVHLRIPLPLPHAASRRSATLDGSIAGQGAI